MLSRSKSNIGLEAAYTLLCHRREGNNNTRMRIKPQFVLPLGNQAVMSFAEINGLCGDNNLDALTGDNHEATELGRRSALIFPDPFGRTIFRRADKYASDLHLNLFR